MQPNGVSLLLHTQPLQVFIIHTVSIKTLWVLLPIFGMSVAVFI